VIGDGLGLLYAGYYGDTYNTAFFIAAVTIPLANKTVLKAVIEGLQQIKKVGSNYQLVMKSDALYSGLPIRFRQLLPSKILNKLEASEAKVLLDKIKQAKFSDEVLTKLGKDLEADDLFVLFRRDVGVVDVWEGLKNQPAWVRKNTNLLDKIKGDPILISKLDNYYSNSHALPGGWKGDPNLNLPKEYRGIEYDAFGFPKLKEYSPGSNSYYIGKLVGEPRATDNLAAMKWLKEESGLVDGVDFKQIGDGKGTVLFDINGKWEKCSWHHHQDGQTLIPVIFEKHNLIAGKHTGGVSIITKYPELIGVFK